MNNGMSFRGCQGRGNGRRNGEGCGLGRSASRAGQGASALGTGVTQHFDAIDEMPNRSAHRIQHVAQMRADIARSPSSGLTAAEREGLLLMREEEKIARDVYIRLFERWGIRPFGNISGSEQAHMDAILALLKHYGLPDPAQGLALGEFRNTELQRLYDRLVKQGLRSLEDAVHVGLLIEELDIADLQKAAMQTDKAAILDVYGELERGSRNHLRAFYRWKQMLGVNYVPQHLSPEIFERTALSVHEDCSALG